jgi:hypothetical protein
VLREPLFPFQVPSKAWLEGQGGWYDFRLAEIDRLVGNVIFIAEPCRYVPLLGDLV